MTGCDEECRQVLSLISEFLDMELPPDINRFISTHLDRCQLCDDFAAGLRHSVALAHAFGPSARPAPLSPEARAALERAWRRAK